MALDQEVKASIIAKYGRKDGDTGSAEVQIALLTSSLFQNHEKNTLKSSYIRGSNFKVGWPTI